MVGSGPVAVLPDGEPERRWFRLSSELVFESEWFRVRRDEVLRPDRTRGRYYHVVVPGSVTVLAMDEHRRVLVTRQWIYLHESAQWRLPGGRIDGTDSDPLAAARRELFEETGVTAGSWRPIGVLNCADAVTNHRDHVFHATDLRLGHRPQLESGESDLSAHWLPFDQVLAMVADGQLPHAGSAFAVLMTGLAAS